MKKEKKKYTVKEKSPNPAFISNELKKLKNRIDWFCENKVNAFSPTISPAPKSTERNEIESIYEGVKYYFDKGIQEIVVQKKYMGSYCDIYLHKDIEKTYFVSRNGHRINHIDLEKAIKACREIHNKINWDNLKIVIIQSELMPWSSLGKGLIENEFEGYLSAHQNHYEYLANSDLYSKIEKVKNSEPYKDFIDFKNTHKESQVKKEYPSHIIRQYEALRNFKTWDLEKYKKGIAIYAEQISHFGKTEELYFKPFNILKKIFEDTTEEIVNDNLSYKELNDDPFLSFKISNQKEFDQTIQEIYSWFETLKDKNEEGIVIKPRLAFSKGIPPAFKIRNNEYLTMIYGIDFIDNYALNIRKRKIERKLECSINDWMLNWEILKVKYAAIDTENYVLKNLVYDRIMGEKIEATLDIRL